MSAFLAKIRGDLRSMSGRLALLGLALGLGIAALALIAGSTSTLLREMARSYEDTRPATATLDMAAPADPAWAESLAGRYGVVEARSGASYQLRFLDGRGKWQPMLLFVVPSLEDSRIAIVFPQAGSPWPPRRGAIALERTAYPTFGLDPGRAIRVKLPDGRDVDCLPETVAHDPGVAPAYQERTAYAYAESATARAWGLEPDTQVKVRLDQGLGWADARKAALALAAALGKEGREVLEVQVPPPHRHPHQGILTTLLMILGAFGLLTIVLCSLLAANAVSSFLAKERRWIGVMKTLGASPARIYALALAPAVAMGLGAVAWSAPLGILASRSLSAAVASLLNFSLRDPSAQWWAWAIPLAAGLLAPPAMAFFPARAARRATILSAIADAGTGGERFPERGGAASRLLSRLSPSLALAWRNVTRKRKRFALSLLLLGVGGGLFMTSFDLGAAWRTLLAESFAARRMDFQARTYAEPTPGALARVAASSSAIDRVEAWSSTPVSVAAGGGVALESTYPDEAHGSFRAYGLPGPTSMLAFPLAAGAWSTSGRDAVLNSAAALRFPGIRPGDRFELIVAGSPSAFRLAGVVREIGQAAAYVDAGRLAEVAGRTALRGEILVALRAGADGDRAKAELEASLERERLAPEILIDNREFTMGGTEHFNLLIAILLALGAVTGVVGWMGIASVLSLSVTERRRELGIVRSLGGTPRSLLLGVMAEAAFMTVLGALAAVAVSLPLAYGLGSFLGALAARMSLPLVMDAPMAALWLAVSLPAAALASLGAGRRAATVAVRETLRYQ